MGRSMKFYRLAGCVLLAIAPSLIWAQDTSQSSRKESDEAQERLLQQGIQLLDAGDPQTAITQYFDKVIAFYDSSYKDSEKRVYGSRGQKETLMYLLTATTDKQSAIVLKPTWGDALYAKAYALIELRRNDEAKGLLERAISMSPGNSQYLSELGHIYQTRKDWPAALAAFTSAEQAANEFSPPGAKIKELTRAMRGIGYVLVELRRYEEAEQKYRRCLELDSRDASARNELQFVKELRVKAGYSETARDGERTR